MIFGCPLRDASRVFVQVFPSQKILTQRLQDTVNFGVVSGLYLHLLPVMMGLLMKVLQPYREC